MKLKQYDRVLWDFNGTLLDDVALCVACANVLLIRRGLAPLENEAAYRRIFGFPVQEYYGRLGIENEGEGFVRAAHEWLREYRAREHTAPLRTGVRSVLAAIKENGVPQGVLSATEEVMLAEQIDALGIGAYFDCVCGRTDIYAGDKTDIAVRYAAEHKGERVLMIGDTLHDAQTAMAGGFDCILVAGGHQDVQTLKKDGCQVFEDFAKLAQWLGVA